MDDVTTYSIRVESHLDAHWSSRLADLAITHNQDGTTTLTGPLVDQAELHSVLTMLRDLNAVLLDLRSNCSSADSPSPA
jgi:hypothetical protein